MADLSIESQIREHLKTLVDPLKQQGHVRGIRYVSDLLITAKIDPELQFNMGPETTIGEDHCGYTMRANVVFKLCLKDYRDEGRAERLMELKGLLQNLLEADDQLNGLANSFLYQGDEKFIATATSPIGGCYLIYQLEYRRKRGAVTQNY